MAQINKIIKQIKPQIQRDFEDEGFRHQEYGKAISRYIKRWRKSGSASDVYESLHKLGEELEEHGFDSLDLF